MYACIVHIVKVFPRATDFLKETHKICPRKKRKKIFIRRSCPCFYKKHDDSFRRVQSTTLVYCSMKLKCRCICQYVSNVYVQIQYVSFFYLGNNLSIKTTLNCIEPIIHNIWVINLWTNFLTQINIYTEFFWWQAGWDIKFYSHEIVFVKHLNKVHLHFKTIL